MLRSMALSICLNKINRRAELIRNRVHLKRGFQPKLALVIPHQNVDEPAVLHDEDVAGLPGHLAEGTEENGPWVKVLPMQVILADGRHYPPHERMGETQGVHVACTVVDSRQRVMGRPQGAEANEQQEGEAERQSK